MKIYKSNANQNRIAQLFLTNQNLTIGFSILVGIPIFFMTRWPQEIKIFLISVIFTLFGAYFNLKIHNKSISALILPYLTFSNSQKKYTTKEISKMSNFYYSIKDNIVFTTDQAIIAVQVFPPDVSILNESEKQIFKNKLASLLHSLDESSIQLKVINRLATITDYQSHIDHLVTQNIMTNASEQVMTITKGYVEDLKQKIKTEPVPFKDYFLIIPQKIGKTPSPQSLKEYLSILEDKTQNLLEMLASNQIYPKRLIKDELAEFYSNSVQNFSKQA